MMMNMDVISHNPYRLLGLLSNASKKEIVAKHAKLRAFAKTGRMIAEDNDFLKLLPAVDRTEQTLTQALNSISLPKDRVTAGLFWFVESTPADEEALCYLRKGKMDKALPIWLDDQNYSACLNLAVAALIKQSWAAALYYYACLLDDEHKRNALIECIAGETDLFTEEELQRIFVDKLLAAFPRVAWMEHFMQGEFTLCDSLFPMGNRLKQSELCASLSMRCCDVAQMRIDSCLATAEEATRKDARTCLKATENFVGAIKPQLHTLRICQGKENREYRRYCDKVANRIVDSCISYYNRDKENHVRARNIRALLRYALRVADGDVVRKRCKENYDYIEKECERLIPPEVEEEIARIQDQIAAFKRQKVPIGYVAQRLDEAMAACSQGLQRIRIALGETNAHYVRISSEVVNFAVSIVMDATDSIHPDREKILREMLMWGKTLLTALKTYAKDTACEANYDKALKYIVELLASIPTDTFQKQQSAKLEIQVQAPQKVVVGERFRFVYKVRNVEGACFTPPSFIGLKLISGPNRATSQYWTTYVYVFSAPVVGNIYISPASVKVGSDVVYSVATSIEVEAMEVSVGSSSKDKVHVFLREDNGSNDKSYVDYVEVVCEDETNNSRSPNKDSQSNEIDEKFIRILIYIALCTVVATLAVVLCAVFR